MKASWKISYLPQGKELFVVPIENKFMAEAKRVSDTESTDRRHPTGAVVVKGGVILGGAANQAGFKHPSLVKLHQNGWCVRRVLKVKSGTKYWLCPGCSTHEDHAESGAVRDAVAKVGPESVKGADVYLWGHYWCCRQCWDNMLKAGVKDVYVLDRAYELFGERKGT